MLSEKRLESLLSKHAVLDKEIEKAEKSAAPDEVLLRKLKKQKLELKEIIASIREDRATG